MKFILKPEKSLKLNIFFLSIFLKSREIFFLFNLTKQISKIIFREVKREVTSPSWGENFLGQKPHSAFEGDVLGMTRVGSEYLIPNAFVTRNPNDIQIIHIVGSYHQH
jgi:hypothetical protein